MSKEPPIFHRGVANGRAKLRSEINNHFKGKHKLCWLDRQVNEQIENQVKNQVKIRLEEIASNDPKNQGWRYEEY